MKVNDISQLLSSFKNYAERQMFIEKITKQLRD